jgi:O-antigen/teichoic acid export membrane protein
MNVLLIPKFGADGAAISSTVSYGIAGILFLFFYSKTVMLPIRVILSYKKTDFDPVFNFLKKLKS